MSGDERAKYQDWQEKKYKIFQKKEQFLVYYMDYILYWGRNAVLLETCFSNW
jgi:hypothetical protein